MFALSQPPGALQQRPTIYAREPGYCVAGWTNMLINVVAAGVSVPMLRATLEAHAAIHANYPSGIGVYTAMSGMPQLPDTAARKQAAESIRSTSGEVLAQVVVIATGGFWGSAARSAMAAINMFARVPNPTGVAGSHEEAAAWMAQYMAIGDEALWSRGLVAAVGIACEQLPGGGD